jgi:phage gp36-like protein
MAYSEAEDVRKLILNGRRAEFRNETPNELDNDQIEFAIKDADAQIDLALARRYALPLEVVPPVIEVLSINIAAYLATLTFRGSTPLSDSDPAVLRYERSRRTLGDIANGRVDIDAPEVLEDVAGQDVFNILSAPLFPTHPTFGREYAEGVIPPDVIYRRTF